MKLTVHKIRSLPDGRHADGNGLYLRIELGHRRWEFRWSVSGVRRVIGLGHLDDVSLAEARAMAADLKSRLRRGEDPAAGRPRHTHVMTFDECASAYIEAHRPSWANEKHGRQWSSTIATYASPVFGRLPIGSVETEHVMRALKPIWETRTETANRLRGRIESILAWATTHGHRSGDNPGRWRGHLEHLLAAPAKVATVRNQPSLPWPQIPTFMAELRARDGTAARALEFAILTAARSGEVRGARWDEIRGDVWVIPGERMKMRREHRVPLSTQALTLLANMPRVSELIFPGSRPGVPLSDMSLSAVIRRMNGNSSRWLTEQGEPIVVHGFRSTFRTWAAEATDYPRELAEVALAHINKDRIESAYQRGDMLEKRRAMMAAWSDFIGGQHDR
jgi:integrase